MAVTWRLYCASCGREFVRIVDGDNATCPVCAVVLERVEFDGLPGDDLPRHQQSTRVAVVPVQVAATQPAPLAAGRRYEAIPEFT